MPQAFQILRAGRMPGQLIGEPVEVTTSSGTFTAETVVMQIAVELVEGRLYSVHSVAGLMGSANGAVVRAQLREDSISGTPRDAVIDDIANATGNTTRKHGLVLHSYYLAGATGLKTFVVTGDLASGGGSVQLVAASNRRSYLEVRYETG